MEAAITNCKEEITQSHSFTLGNREGIEGLQDVLPKL
jgi:hypothetical protein